MCFRVVPECAILFAGPESRLIQLEGDELTTTHDFRTFHNTRRMPAEPMRPVIDPAGWAVDSLGPVGEWAYRISDTDQDEILAAVEEFKKHGLPLTDVSKDTFPLKSLAAVLADI